MLDDATKRLHRQTTDTPPGIWGYVCYSIRIPYHPDVISAFEYYLSRLNFVSAWFQRNPDFMTADDMAQLMKQAYERREIVDCMIGSLVSYITEEPPAHVLPCDGGVYQRADYPYLYNVLASSLKLSASEFTLPDMRGRTLIGEGEGDGLTERDFLETGGAERVSLTVDQLAAHDHTYYQPTYNIDVESVGVPDPTGVGLPAIPTQTSTVGAGESHQNMMPFIAVKIGVIAR